MAETINIAKMAEILSKGIFGEFLWQRNEQTNLNWKCENQDTHGVKTHPSDVVFWYDEPYSQTRTYVNCDLKSYARKTITAASVKSAIESLANTLECAEISSEFQDLFIHQNVTANICGLLFIYNHDGEYDKDFSVILEKIKSEDLNIPRGTKIVVFGPEDIFWLNNVHHEIAYLRGGEGLVPNRDYCQFFYPHLVGKKNIQMDIARAANLEMLTSTWIILSYKSPQKNNKQGYVIFLRRNGRTVDEFLYLIDYLMHYQVIKSDNEVSIRILNPHDNAISNFAKAKDEYIEACDGGDDMRIVLNAIQFDHLNNILTKFSEKAISRDE